MSPEEEIDAGLECAVHQIRECFCGREDILHLVNNAHPDFRFDGDDKLLVEPCYNQPLWNPYYSVREAVHYIMSHGSIHHCDEMNS